MEANAEKTAQTYISREKPASPMRPGEEAPIEGESSAEEIVTEEEQAAKSVELPRPDWTWQHREAKPAERVHGPRHVELEQTAYLVLWFQKGEACRKRWERNWSEDPGSKDEAELAKRLRSLDKRVGEGTTYAEIQKTLKTLQGQEAENWQRENGDGSFTVAEDAEYKAGWESYSWNN